MLGVDLGNTTNFEIPNSSSTNAVVQRCQNSRDQGTNGLKPTVCKGRAVVESGLSVCRESVFLTVICYSRRLSRTPT